MTRTFSWKLAVDACYFALTALVAVGLATFIFNGSLLGIFLGLVIVTVSTILFSGFRAFNLPQVLQAAVSARAVSAQQVATIIAIFSTVFLSWLSYVENYVLLAAVFLGATGGVFHEVAQSNGKFILPQRDAEGNWYLGALFGLMAGGVTGLILVQGLSETTLTSRFVSEAFLAGLGMKGFADATAGVRPSSPSVKGAQSNSTPSPPASPNP